MPSRHSMSRADVNLWRVPLSLTLAAAALFGLTMIPDTLDAFGIITFLTSRYREFFKPLIDFVLELRDDNRMRDIVARSCGHSCDYEGERAS